MVWGLLTFVIGLLYGWLSPGRENKMRLLRNGVIFGLLLAIVLGLIGFFTGYSPLGVGSGRDMLSLFVSVVILTLLFVLGAWIGDLIEGWSNRRRMDRTV